MTMVPLRSSHIAFRSSWTKMEFRRCYRMPTVNPPLSISTRPIRLPSRRYQTNVMCKLTWTSAPAILLNGRARIVVDACGFPYKSGTGWAVRSFGFCIICIVWWGLALAFWRYIVRYSSIHMLILDRLRYGILLSTTGKGFQKEEWRSIGKRCLITKTSGAEVFTAMLCNALDHVAAHPE